MRQLYVLVEGQTEESFVRDTLAVHLNGFGLDPRAIVVKTKRLRSGKAFKGGTIPWGQIKRQVYELLRASHAAGVTTMLDFYGLPSDFPGQDNRPTQPRTAVEHLERCAGNTVGDPRFIPYLSLHEFEALLFADPHVVAQRAGKAGVELQLQAALSDCKEPELVDDGPTTAPSKRIIGCWPRYAKSTDGPSLAAEIGMDRLRAACPHFDGWICRLESL
ncbi:MAG: DUF4276 family protein [Egibacteraceae bacterium]